MTPFGNYVRSKREEAGITLTEFAEQRQDELQRKYTGGTVLHLYLGERVSSAQACKNLVRRALGRFRLPYITITPTFSICPTHGYLAGEHAFGEYGDLSIEWRLAYAETTREAPYEKGIRYRLVDGVFLHNASQEQNYTRFSAVEDTVVSAAVDFGYLLAQAEVESSMDPDARAATSSAASSSADWTVAMVRTDCSAPPRSARPPEASCCTWRSWREMSAAVAFSACSFNGSSSTRTSRVTPPTRATAPTPRTPSMALVTVLSTNQLRASSSILVEATV